MFNEHDSMFNEHDSMFNKHGPVFNRHDPVFNRHGPVSHRSESIAAVVCCPVESTVYSGYGNVDLVGGGWEHVSYTTFGLWNRFHT